MDIRRKDCLKATRRLDLKLPRLPHRCSITEGSQRWGSFGPLQRSSHTTREFRRESVNLSIRVSKLMSMRHCLSAVGGGAAAIPPANFQAVPGKGGDIGNRRLPRIRIQVLAQTARQLQTKGLEGLKGMRCKSRARMKAGGISALPRRRRRRRQPRRRLATAQALRLTHLTLRRKGPADRREEEGGGRSAGTRAGDRRPPPQRKALGSRGLRSVLLPLPQRPRK